ncbi:hypothetical protein, partial [Aquiflexum lacus]|uniref:hypothetical protein n=1 Tax=Aquiflexum lacus TaxID=2483805 RepID=UPI003743CAAD
KKWSASPEQVVKMDRNIQPILENAILHGFKGLNHPLSISIRIEKNEIEISNNGAPLDGESFGTGMRIVEQRLKHHFENEVELNLYQNKENVVGEIKGLNL